MKKFNFVLFVALAAILFSASIPANAQSAAMEPKDVLAVMQRVADWQLANPSKHKATDWTQGAGDAGFMALAGISGDAKYRGAMFKKGETNEWNLGPRKFHADDHAVGQAYCELYFLYRDPKMLAPMRARFDSILAEPSKVESLAFKQPKGAAGENWSWCDSLFMAPPAWARLYYATGDEKYLTFAVTNWWRTTAYLYDKEEHLYFRDSTYFEKREANGKKVFWGRGNGWVMGGLVRLLQYLPSNHPDRARFEQLFKDMAAKILTCQQPDGLWRASLLDPASYPLKETSSSGFYTYALAWGVNQGLLDRNQFEPAVHKAWAALVSCVDADGKLTHVQPIGADPKNFDENGTEVYGVGAFLLAGSEVYRMGALAIPMIPTTEISSTNTDMIPQIDFDAAQITSVIDALANFAGIHYVLDPKIDYDQPDANGIIKSEPIISVHWAKITTAQALQMVLDSGGFQFTQDKGTKTIYIKASSSKISPCVSSPIILKVVNPASLLRNRETVSFNRRYIFDNGNYASANGLLAKKLVVMDGVSSRILDSQVYSESNSVPDKLLFQVDLAPGETRTFYILDASALPAVPPPALTTFARFVPERLDDFAWENDRIAFRMYGPALQKQDGDKTGSGVDVWCKHVRALVVDAMYARHTTYPKGDRRSNYHNDDGTAADNYRAGPNRGCGGAAIWADGKLRASRCYQSWKLITSGPIRSEFELTYAAWDVNGQPVSEVKRVSLDRGSNLNRFECRYDTGNRPVTAAAGLVIHSAESVLAHQDRWFSLWEKFTEGDGPGHIPVGLVWPAATRGQFKEAEGHALVLAELKAGEPFVYYAGAGWDRNGDFTNQVQWENYLKRFAERLDQPLKISVGN